MLLNQLKLLYSKTMFRPTINQIGIVAKSRNFPIFVSNGKFNANLNIWGIRSPNKNTKEYNDCCVVFWENTRRQWALEYFEITTDPSNLLLENPINIDGTAILKEGHHKAIWALGHHKGRMSHKALVQVNPCEVYRDNNKDDIIDKHLPIQKGMFGINMHRASEVQNNHAIGLYSAGCQVHYDISKYIEVFIPLIERCVKEGHTTFSYTLCLEEWFKV